MFLQEFQPIEAEAFLTLAAALIEDDDVVTVEEDALLDRYAQDLGVIGFTYDSTAVAAARDTMAQLNEVSKRKVYMELFLFAICDGFEDPAERRTIDELREALELDPKICHRLEDCAKDLYSLYTTIEQALEAPASTEATK